MLNIPCQDKEATDYIQTNKNTSINPNEKSKGRTVPSYENSKKI